MTTILEVAGVTKRFGGLVANDDVTLTVSVGEILGLMGPNGAGKTTLFDLVSGEQQVDRGVIRLDGRSIEGLSAHKRNRAGLARTFQKLRLFLEMTVLENVIVAALPRASSVRVASERSAVLLEAMGLTPKVNSAAGTLSTGQRKRLEVARALATKPRLLLLDEPLAGVDPENVRSMVRLIKDLRDQGQTIILIEHNLRALMTVADRVVAMHLGRKIAEGKPLEVAEHPTVVSAYLGQTYASS